jgi:hypothetical protein
MSAPLGRQLADTNAEQEWDSPSQSRLARSEWFGR